VKRSVGLTLLGIAIILLSSLALLLSGVALVVLVAVPFPGTTVANGPTPEQVRAAGIAGTAFLFVIESLGVVCGLGLLRLWNWTRYVTIVTGFLFGGFSAVMAVVVLVMPITPTSGIDSNSQHSIQVAMALFYFVGVVFFIGTSAFLMRKSIALQFQRGLPGRTEAKPFAVLTVAGLMLASLISLPFMVMTHFPVLLFGIEFTSLAARFAVAIWICALGFAGIALIRKSRNAFWLALGLQLAAVVNGLLSLRPGVLEHYMQQMPTYFAGGPAAFSGEVAHLSMLIGIVSASVPLLLLAIGRKKYFAWCEQAEVPVVATQP
jgi:hypothetical protein